MALREKPSVNQVVRKSIFGVGLAALVISCGEQEPAFQDAVAKNTSDDATGQVIDKDVAGAQNPEVLVDVLPDGDAAPVDTGTEPPEGEEVVEGPGDKPGDKDPGNGSEPPLNYEAGSKTITQLPAGKVDILWIVDSSGSMEEEQAYLGQNFQSFIAEMTASDADFQTAVTSSDICTAEIPEALEDRACPADYGGNASTQLRGSFVGAPGNEVLSESNPNMLSLFADYTAVGIDGSGFEHGLKAAELAVQKSLSGDNPALLRPDAFLSIIVVSDEEDDGIGLSQTDSYNGNNFWDLGLTRFKYTEDNLIDYLKTAKGEGKFAISTITGTKDESGVLCTSAHSQPQEEGLQYIKAATKTGGITQSICENDWSQSLGMLGRDLQAQTSQVALGPNVHGPSIKVYVDGVANTKWTFVEGNSSVKFNSDAIPPVGSTIKVDYFAAP